MDDAPQNFDVGIAGSITMLVLVAAVTLLMVSFYRRYKRAAGNPEDDQQ
jgi:heme/copper-type cytochrome/quinol oxidase subunit 2